MRNASSRPLLLLVLALLAARPALAEERATFLHNPPDEAEASAAMVIEGVLSSPQQMRRVVIRYRGPGEPYAESTLELQYGDLYRGSIPAAHMVAPGVEYYVEGLTRDGDRVPLLRSATRPARVLVKGPVPSEEPPSFEATATPPSTPVPPPSPKPSVRPPPAPVSPKPARATPVDDSMAVLSADLPPESLPASTSSRTPAVRTSSAPSAPSRSDDSQFEEELALYTAEDTLALATRHEEKVRKVPAIAASFGREQIRALGARTVADVLDVVPGLTVSRDVQGFHRVAVRGLRNDAEVLFLLDGHRLNGFFDGRALFNLPVDNLERIEVIRGPGSALYGTGAFLGVVNLVTARAEGMRVSASGGGYPDRARTSLAPTVDGHIAAGQDFGALRLSGDVDVWSQAGGSYAIDKDALDASTLIQGLREPLEPAGYTHDDRFLLNTGLKLDYETESQGRLGVSLRFLTESRGALIGLFDTVGEDSRLGWNVFLGDIAFEQSVGDALHLRARLSGDMQQTDRLFQITPRNFRTGEGADQLFPEGMLERTRLTTGSFSLNLDADARLGDNNRLSLGTVAELQLLTDYAYETNYTLDSRRREELAPLDGLVNVLAVAAGAPARRMTLGFFIQDQWTVIEPLTLTVGMRVDAIQLPQVDEAGDIVGTALVPSVNPRMGLVFSATDALVLKLLYGRAFRAPTLQELLETIPNTDYNQGRFVGNPLLRPAVVDTLEAGADLLQAAGDARVRLRGNVFFERFGSPIVPVDSSGNINPVRNRELGVLVYGVEGEARLEASTRAHAWVNASFFRAEDLELPAQSRLLTDTPQARFNAGVTMPIGEWIDFDFVVRAGAERRNNSRSVLELIRRYEIPAYSLITAQLRTQPLAGHFEVALIVHNLFEQDMRDDVPRPDYMTGLLPREGVSAYLTVRATY